MIYFAQLPSGSIKIGYSADVGQRLSGLRSHYGCDVEVLHTMEGDRETERALHQRFAHLRFGRTEQFRPGPDLVAFIGRPLIVSANPDAVASKHPAPLPVCFNLNSDDHRTLRVVAAKEGKSMAAFVRDVVMGIIEKERSNLR